MLARLDQTKDSEAIGYFTSEHLRMSGAYWAIGGNYLLGNKMGGRRTEMI
jgi:geranylgeranyl transferase type-2 subunit beta